MKLYNNETTREELAEMRQILVNALSRVRVGGALHNEYTHLLDQINKGANNDNNERHRRRTRKFKNGRRITRRNR